MRYRIGTRGSKLALAQAEWVGKKLKERYPELEIELKIIKTTGDLVKDRPLNQIGDKGVFVKEIEQELLDGTVDIAVHSMKDMPAEPAEGLCFTKAWEREDPRDVLILREKKHLMELPEGAVIGTGSPRRKYQLLRLRPDLKVVDIRGNVETRIRKMYEQQLDGIVLAAAGLHRLGMQDVITQYLDETEMISAPGQGILAIEIQKDREDLRIILDGLHKEETESQRLTERGFLQEIGGSCHAPIGAVCKQLDEQHFELHAVYGTEDGSRLVFAKEVGTDPNELAVRTAAAIRKQMAGMVHLVGAGPGDPDLITVKGLQAIREADCIIYDRLASPELLKEAKGDCECIYVGKEKRNHTMKQEEINTLLIEKAMQYKHVVRLKGGDVYVFGRGGEEGMALHDHGVPFEVIPGISSATAGLAYAGIPVTHRGVASGFHVVTAHDQNEQLAEIDFAAMAKGKETCIFLMGLSKLREIVEGLLGEGMVPETMAAVVHAATTEAQKVVTAPLNKIVDAVRRENISSPALIVVGDVVALREQLDFWKPGCLKGKRFLIPKIGEAETELKRRLEASGAIADELQLGKIEYLTGTFTEQELQAADWLVFTSKYGVEGFMQTLANAKIDREVLKGKKIAVIGIQTAAYLEKYGWKADLIPEAYHSDALQQCLKETVSAGEKVLYFKAKNAQNVLDTCARSILVYENAEIVWELPSDEALQAYDGVLFTCASLVNRFFAHVQPTQLSAECQVYSIGPKCSEALRKWNIERFIQAKKSDYESLMTCIRKGMCE